MHNIKERLLKNAKTTLVGFGALGFGAYTLIYIKDTVQAYAFFTAGTTLLFAKD